MQSTAERHFELMADQLETSSSRPSELVSLRNFDPDLQQEVARKFACFTAYAMVGRKPQDFEQLGRVVEEIVRRNLEEK